MSNAWEMARINARYALALEHHRFGRSGACLYAWESAARWLIFALVQP